MKIAKYLISALIITSAIFAQDSSQTFLSLRNTGVEAFQKVYPEYDGRGTIVFVLDTGIDMGVDGLTKTSTGEVKVIDVQDFTGQGDIPFYEAETDEDNDTLFFINEEKEFKVAGAGKLTLKAKDDNYFIGVVKESLWKNSGSRAGDINGNGSLDDNFYFVTFPTEKNEEQFWVVYLDTDSDGDLSDEKPLRNYKENYDSFIIPNQKGLPKFTLALNIFPEKKLVSFFFDDGSHGTHCAGISTGNMIGDNQLYGIAPGAKLIGLKLGNNNLAGGATVAESMKKAYLYADKVSKEREEPCIINMSFGIGSEIEGRADIELFLDELVENNPYLYISTSNGNEGPGISTTGMPSASTSIFSTGAVLAKEVGNDLYGTTLNKDIILHFSSRGGEVLKPDLVAPGACVSTVPNFAGGDRFWGTSMASPYSAGVMAVLLGAAKVEFPDVKIPSLLLYKVLRESATPMQGYNFVDQGNGLINIEAAFELLKKYIKKGELKKFETYTITSFAPNMPDNRAPNLYIRDASFLDGTEKFIFRIKRNNFQDNKKFYRLYNLKSSAGWLKPVQKKIHIRNNQSVYVNVQVDKSILSKPGLYNAIVRAARADKTNMPEFELMTTIVVPHIFEPTNNYSQNFDNEKVEPGMHKRYFLKIPVGTTGMKLSLSSKRNEYTNIRYYLHDPDGRKKFLGFLNAKLDEDKKVNYINDFTPGVYELVVLGQFTSDEESIYSLEVELNGVNIIGHGIDKNKNISLVNYFNKAKIYNVSGKLVGYKKSYTVKLNGEKTYEIPFQLDKGESKKTFEVTLSKEDFNKVTDFALMIYDEDGKAQAVGGLSYIKDESSVKKVSKEEVENYRFVMIPGFANAPSDISISIVEKTYFYNEHEIIVLNNSKSKLTLYPDIKYKLDCDFDYPEIKIPEGSDYFGELIFTSPKTKDVELTKTINIIK